MTDIIPDIALVDNTSQRLPCILVVDASGSMEGGPISELNAGLKVLEEELKKDEAARQRVRLLVVRVGGSASIATTWTDAIQFSAPHLTATGGTPLGEGVRLALRELDDEKRRYNANGISYNRPWLFIFTDGEPTDLDWEAAADECRTAEAANKAVIFPIASSGANVGNLGRFSTGPVHQLQGLEYRKLFLWLSRSARAGSVAQQGSSVQMPSPSEWRVPT